jgi:hypothetical protein
MSTHLFRIARFVPPAGTRGVRRRGAIMVEMMLLSIVIMIFLILPFIMWYLWFANLSSRVAGLNTTFALNGTMIPMTAQSQSMLNIADLKCLPGRAAAISHFDNPTPKQNLRVNNFPNAAVLGRGNVRASYQTGFGNLFGDMTITTCFWSIRPPWMLSPNTIGRAAIPQQDMNESGTVTNWWNTNADDVLSDKRSGLKLGKRDPG